VSAFAILVLVATLLAAAAVREAVAPGEREIVAGRPNLLRSPAAARVLRAAWRLGLPERLARSGLADRISLPTVVLAKLAGLAAGAVFGWLAAPAAPGRLSLLVAAALPAGGFLAPDAALEREARRRHRRLVAALPDALDLLAVGSAAGRSPGSGLAEIGRASDGPLAAELRVVAAELDCGTPLTAALRSLRRRSPGSEIAALCAAIERSHRLGSPLAEQLRRQSTALRRDQRRGVGERAARAAPKIQLVVALVLVPSVLLMIAAGLIANADLLLAGF
jgi:tight adherence protein C